MTNVKENLMQDAPASIETTYAIAVGDSFEGRLEGRTDQDWVRVELVAGRSYDIRLTGIGYDGIENTYLRVFNSAGEEVAFNDNADGAAWDLTSMLEFSPDDGGVYYLSAGNYRYTGFNTTGPYLMTITDEEDNNTGTPHTVSPNGRFNGTLDSKFDEDWIRVELVAGKTYTITLAGTGPDTDTDTILRLYDSAGEQVAFHDDVDYAAGKVNSVVTFTPVMTGTYYVGAGAYRGNPNRDNAGHYQVTVYDEEAATGFTITGTEESDSRHNELVAGPGDDVLDGGDGYDWLEGGAGADEIRGGLGADMARYLYSDAGVEVNLEEGTARGGHAEGDTFPGEVYYIFYDDNGELTAATPGTGILFLLGSAYDDILVGHLTTNFLFGYYGDDELDGRGGDDTLFGGPGADSLKGGDGIDTVSYVFSDAAVEVRLHDGTARGGEAEGDTFAGTMMVGYTDPDGNFMSVEVPDIENLNGSRHADILVGAHGRNTFVGHPGDDMLDGREGDDLLSGGQGDDELHGGGGVDQLYGGDGNDELDGGEGDDQLYGGDGNDELDGGEGDDQLFGQHGNDELDGGEGDDQLFGQHGNDELDGGEGDDWLAGGAGEDTLTGGAGMDTAYYLVSDTGVEVRLHDGTARGGEAEGDMFAGKRMVEYTDPEGNTQSAEVSDIERLFGSNHDDILAGDRGDNTLAGFSGADELDGREGDDELAGGAGGDALRGGAGIDDASYRLSDAGVEVRLHDGTARGGHAEGDMLTGIENLTGSRYADILAGDSGDNRLEGLAGADELIGGPGRDTADYSLSDAGVEVRLHDGAASGGDAEGDTLSGIENLIGSDYADILVGDSNANRLEGGEGDDRLEGLGGADELVGGPGSDTAAYSLSYAGVEIRLHDGTLRGGDAEGDTFGTEMVEYTDDDGNTQVVELPDIENLTGSDHADILEGDLRDNRLEGLAGADELIGGPGSDTAVYSLSNAGVVVNLHDGTARGGHAEGDTLTGIENLTGSGYADILEGDLRDNWLEGLGGADELIGGPGSDTAVYSLSNAGVWANLHDGTVRGGDAEGDTFSGIENLTGSRHADRLIGDSGGNRLEGGAGNDFIDGRDGADELVGGPGLDAAVYQDSPAGVEVRLHDGTARGGYAEGDSFPEMQTIDYVDTDGVTREVEVSDIERLYGSEFDDILAGDFGDNVLSGFSGADELDGGEGDDVLNGGAGADTLRGSDGTDVAVYADSNAGVEVRLHDGTAKGGEAEGDTLTGIENLTGSDHDDILSGNHMDNQLEGKGGDDAIEGRGGDDRLEGAFGNDVLDGGEGDDTLSGQGGADRLIGGPGEDTAAYTLSYTGVVVRLHDGTLRGGDAEGDTFAGMVMVEYTDPDGNTQMVELPDIERLTGSAYDDVLAGDFRDNWLRGGFGNDILYGGPGGGDDNLQGGIGNDKLYGGIGDDYLEGNAGNDLLWGGLDDDHLFGGAGDDTFFFAPGGGDDIIQDFGSGADKIDLTAFEDIRSIADLDLAQNVDDLEIDLSAHGGGTVTLLFTEEADLTDEIFIFFSDDAALMT